MLPGEIGFQVLDDNGKPLDHKDTLSPRDSVTEATRPLWWQSAWGSVVTAGKPTVDPAHAPRPADRIRAPKPSAGTSGRPRDRPRGRRRHRGRSSAARPARSTTSAHRCPCGNPDVVATEPRLEDGTPFPTTFYLTCPRAASLIGTLEASGLMKEMTDRLETDPELAAAYRGAHEAYLAAPRVDRPRAGDRRRLRRRDARPG